MINNEVPIHIHDDPYSSLERFVTIASDMEFGNQGTIRIQSYSFLDGEAVYLNLGGTEVRREAGFQKALLLTKQNQDSRSYVFRCGQWYQQTTSPHLTLTSLQRAVGQYGFWVGLYQWCLDVGDFIVGILSYLAAPVVVVPILALRAFEFLLDFVILLSLCLAIWQLILEAVASLFLGPAVIP